MFRLSTSLLGVDKDLLALGSTGHGHDPILPATILPHDGVDDADMRLAVRVAESRQVSTPHARKDRFKVVHLFPFPFPEYMIGFWRVNP